MDTIDEKLAELEKSLPVETQEPEPTPEPEAPNLKSLQDMTYEETKENIKKAALVSTGKDKNYVAELHEQSKDVLTGSIELERARVEKEKQEILLEHEKLTTQKEKELNERLREKFGAKLDRQEYHYKSLKPILETFGIKNPMNIYVMWIIAILGCVTGIYPLKLLFCATFGNLIAGANSDSRKGFAKGCMWTLVAVLGIGIIVLVGFALVKIGIGFFG